MFHVRKEKAPISIHTSQARAVLPQTTACLSSTLVHTISSPREGCKSIYLTRWRRTRKVRNASLSLHATIVLPCTVISCKHASTSRNLTAEISTKPTPGIPDRSRHPQEDYRHASSNVQPSTALAGARDARRKSLRRISIIGEAVPDQGGKRTNLTAGSSNTIVL